LAAAISWDRAAALQSTSWGIGQVLGQNFAMVGFADVEAMVTAMSASEDDQLTAVGNLVLASGLSQPLSTHDWKTFARGYNGPSFAKNNYHGRLNDQFQSFSTGPLPDVLVRAVQLYLTYLGFSPGRVDGVAGTHTFAALARFQSANGLPVTTTIDPNTVTQIQNRLPPV
jgi:hypothetical protein